MIQVKLVSIQVKLVEESEEMVVKDSHFAPSSGTVRLQKLV